MMSSWRLSSRTRALRHLLPLAAIVLVLSAAAPRLAGAQATEDVFSPAEVDQLRDAAFVPRDRISVYEHILDDRQKHLADLLARRRGHADFGSEVHDSLDQMGQIASELNDNLDEYSKHHRDVRKSLPKLIQATERWSTTLRAAGEEEAFSIVRRIALDNVKDTREICDSLQADLDAYFKAHPEAAKEENGRSKDPYAVRPGTEGPPLTATW